MEILTDRIKFKLYAAKKHLDNLIQIDHKYNNILSDRLNSEQEIDCFFAQLIGAKDALLVHINEKLNLGLKVSDVDLENINIELKKVDRQYLIDELNKLSSDDKKWLWLANELRNYTLHRNMLKKHVAVGFEENLNTGVSLINQKCIS